MTNKSWTQRFAIDWIFQTHGMTAREKGVYTSLLMQIHNTGKPIEEDYLMIGRLCGERRGVAKDIVSRLIDADDIQRVDEGLTINRAFRRRR